MAIRLQPPGILVAFEGIDGAGKTTQANRLAERLRAADIDFVQSKEPTSGKWGTLLRASATTGRLSPEDELAAFVNDRREHVETLIRPALKAGKVVIVDRYYFSTVAYQGARGLDAAEVMRANEAFAPEPDLLVLLEVAPEVRICCSARTHLPTASPMRHARQISQSGPRSSKWWSHGHSQPFSSRSFRTARSRSSASIELRW